MNLFTSSSKESGNTKSRAGFGKPGRLRYRNYLGLIAVTVFFGAALGGWMNYTKAFPFWIAACDSTYYSDEYYIANCPVPGYGSYEHGALYLGLEPEAVKHLKNARVVFMGNSRAQVVFSTKAVDRYFRDRKIPYYLAGFGNNEGDLFSSALIRKWDLRADVIIINFDEFFRHVKSGPAREILAGGWWIRTEYALKRWAQGWHRGICADESKFKTILCGDIEAIYRSRITGQWWIPATVQDRNTGPITVSLAMPYSSIPGWVYNARYFKELLDAQGTCLVFTTVPREGGRQSVAGPEIARQLGVPYVDVAGEDWFSFDGSHLNRNSAERWSAAFLNEFDGIMRSCRKTGSRTTDNYKKQGRS